MNKRNYQKELDIILDGICSEKGKDGNELPSLLLHSCCAPCSSYCIEYLAKYFNITLLYYNPNISPKEEYDKRMEELIRLVEEMQSKGVYPKGRVRAVGIPYDPKPFIELSAGLEEEKEGGSRCYKCYSLRLKEAARYGAEHGFDYFTTTLSISPVKNPVWINEIGEQMGEKYKIKHLPSEFRKKGGYLRSIELSAEYGLYRQNFCGCEFSRN